VKCVAAFIATAFRNGTIHNGAIFCDINRIFWLIPIADYNSREDCVIKKQMKIVSKSCEEYEEYKSKLEDLKYYSEHVIKEIDNPNARRIKFKDERKITVGLSKKDIMVCRGKVKNAFYNCFAMILRFYQDGEFKEIHVKYSILVSWKFRDY